MNLTNYLLLAFSFLLLTGCSKTDADKDGDEPSIMFPNYLVINAQSKNPDMQWHISDFFKKEQEWELETTDLRDAKPSMYELTQFPNLEATPAQEDAANKLIDDSFDTVMRNGWLSKDKAFSDGYEKMYGDPVHFVNIEYVFDGETLNPDKPEVLMYYKTENGDFLMGIMFLAIGQRGPQVAGPLSEWHYHIDRRMCYERGVLPIGGVDEGGSCATGFTNTRSPEMLHVWFFDHPEGRFATKMWLSEEQLRAGIKQVLAGK